MSADVPIYNSFTTSVGVFMVRNGYRSTDMYLSNAPVGVFKVRDLYRGAYMYFSNYIGRSIQGT